MIPAQQSASEAPGYSDKGVPLTQGRFRLEVKKKIFPEKMVSNGNKLLRESLWLEVF